jgi:type IV secretory pathway VirB10-like protein
MDPVEPLDREARDLLAAYRRERPGPHGRARNWPGVRARVEPRVASRRGALSPWWFGAIAVAVAAGVLLLVHAVFVALQATQAEPTRVPEAIDEIAAPPPEHASAPVVGAPPPVQSPARAVAPAPIQRPQARVAAPAPTPRTDTTREENQLLAEAKTAMNDEAWTDALVHLDEHARRFPSGVLAEERAALRAIALCRTHDASAAAAVRAFRSRHPGSHHHRSIELACAASENASAP